MGKNGTDRWAVFVAFIWRYHCGMGIMYHQLMEVSLFFDQRWIA